MKNLNQILLAAYSASNPISSGVAELSSGEVAVQTGRKVADTDRVSSGTDKLFFPQMTIAMMQQIISAVIVMAHIIIIIR